MSRTYTENTKGVFLGVIWLDEAVTILGVPVLLAAALMRSRPFMRDGASGWAAGLNRGPPHGLVRSTADVRRKLEAGDFSKSVFATLGLVIVIGREADWSLQSGQLPTG